MIQVWKTDLPPLAPRDLGAYAGRYEVPDHPVLSSGNVHLPPALISAVPQRQVEFLAGRQCALHALRSLGMPAVVPEVGPRGAPVWPSGAVGSITHTNGEVICVVGLRSTYAGIGIDLERHLLETGDVCDLEPLVGSEAEWKLVRRVQPPHIAFTVLFSVKEAVYKAIHDRAGRFVDFSEVQCVEVTPNSVLVRLTHPLASATKLERPLRVIVHAGEVTCLSICVL